MQAAIAQSTARPAVARTGRTAGTARGRPCVASRAAAEEVKAASTNGAPSKPSNAAMDFDELTELIKMVHATDIVELELNSKKFKLSVKKKEALEAAEPTIIHMPAAAPAFSPAPVAAAPAAAAPAAPAAPAPAPAAPAPAAAAAPAAPAPAAPAAVDGLEVVSPMAGTMYRSPAPGEPAFVKEGDRVTKGQTICIVEAMKLLNEIEAEVGGTVVKVLVDNGDAVLPGQPLMIIKP